MRNDSLSGDREMRKARTDADVIVVGLGTMGSAVTWRLAARGARVLGVEQFQIGHDRGSGHGESRIIRTAYHEDPAYVPLAQAAWRLWRELESQCRIEVLTRTGALMFGQPDSGLIAGALAAVAVHGLPHELLDTAEAVARYPQHVPGTDDVAVFEPQAGFLRPERAITTMASAALAAGAQLSYATTVVAVEPADDHVVVRLRSGVLTASHVVVCAGSWTGRLVPGIAGALTVERQVPVWFPVLDADGYRPSRFPVFIRAIDGHIMYGIPSLDDGSTAKVAIHHEGVAVDDPDRVERAVKEHDVANVCELVRRSLRGLEPAPARAMVCLYTNSPDGHFVVGQLPGADRVTVISACSGHGFKFAPVIGDITADLVLDGGTEHPIGLFDPRRLPLASPG